MIEIFKNLSNREKKLIIILLAIIFSYVLYLIIFVPTIGKLKKLENNLLELEEEKVHLNNQVNKYKKLKAKYQSDSYEKLLLKFPETGKIPEIILWLQELFQDSNLSRPNVTFSKTEKQEQYLQIFLSFTGPYSSVQNLIKKIEANERLTTIESTNLIRGTSDSIATNLVIKVYGKNFTDVSEEKYNFNNVELFK